MASLPRIHTPLVQRWHRFRQQVLPVLCFIACAAFVLWLWERQARVGVFVGEVRSVRIDVPSTVAGVLDPEWRPPNQEQLLSAPLWSHFDTVEEGEVIARLNPEPLQLSLKTMQATLAQLRSEVEAERARVGYDHWRYQHERQREIYRILWEVLTLRLDVLDRQTAIAADEIELHRLENQVRRFQQLMNDNPNAIAELDLEDAQFQRDRIQRQIAKNRLAETEAAAQRDQLARQLEDFRNARVLLPEVEELLAPLEDAVRVQESLIRELLNQIAGLEIRAPIKGTIVDVHAWPHQSVQPGDPIVTIASNESVYALGYIRPEQRIHPIEGMMVELRPRHRRIAVESTIERIGPQVELVPQHQLMDPTIPEWGLPVRIRIPEKLNVRPGDLLDIVVPASARKAPD